MYLYRYQSNSPGIHAIKPGSVLIAQKIFGNELLDRSVILILEHDETGSTGVILNKSNFFSKSLSVLSNRDIGYGGSYDPQRRL